MLDATKDDKQIEILESELHTVGIRLNSQPPDIYYKPKKVRNNHRHHHLHHRHCHQCGMEVAAVAVSTDWCLAAQAGGLAFNSTVPLTHIDEKVCRLILHEYSTICYI
jgi:ribosome-interacting GTPase 1